MLAAALDDTTLFVCTTCRGPGRVDDGGKVLAAQLATIATEPAYGAIAVLPVECLWSCAQGVSVQLRGPAKIGYVMGGFVADDARDLLDFAVAHTVSVDGVVPYDRWPDGVRGHFIARTPPARTTFG